MNEAFPLPLTLRKVDGSSFLGRTLYRLESNFEWRGITVPAGFKTDLASVPPPLNAKGYQKAAVIHDYLCNKVRSGQSLLTMAAADRCLYDAMIDDGASKMVAYIYWKYVRARHILKGEK